MAEIQVIVNPAAGQGKAPEFVEKYVIAILEAVKRPYQIHRTNGEGDGNRVGAILYNTLSRDSTHVLVVAGGDGTAHEVIEGIYTSARDAEGSSTDEMGRWELIILPLGTANALFHSLYPPQTTTRVQSEVSQQKTHLFPDLQIPSDVLYQLPSLLNYLSNHSSPKKLPISLTTLLDPSSPNAKPNPIPSHIVLSTALHAGILKSSEALRQEYPGLERFKIAAQENVGIFHPATVRLFRSLDGILQQWSPKSQSFTTPWTIEGPDTLSGPFAYLLSANTTPRLESNFVIAPTLERSPPKGQTMDLVVLRPMRDPVVRKAIEENGEKAAPEAWIPRIWEALMKAYEEGKHVDMVYDGEGPLKLSSEVESEDGQENVCVEVFRCGGFEWSPEDPSHQASHVVCADGSLYSIPPNGSAKVTLMKSNLNDSGFFAWS